MIDLHCHILPEIDDGPSTLDESLELARRAVAEGVRIAAATPHLRSDHPAVVPTELAQRCHALQAELASHGISLDLLPAGELDLVWALEATAEELKLVSYGQTGRDLLIETPYGPLDHAFEPHLFGFILRGYRVLLAHPERNPTFQKDPARLADAVRRGVLIQLTADSLARSPRRSRSARLARDLLKGGLGHVIASDAHGPSVPHRAMLSHGVHAARKLIGPRADWMITDVPKAIVGGRMIPDPPALRSGRARSRLLGPG